MSIYIKYIYLRYIYLYNVHLYIEEFPAGKAPREFELCAVVVSIARKKEPRVSCKENHGTVAARRYQGCRNVLRDLWNLSRSPGKERIAFRTTSNEITVYASETRINMGQYGCQPRHVILRYIFRVSHLRPSRRLTFVVIHA